MKLPLTAPAVSVPSAQGPLIPLSRPWGRRLSVGMLMAMSLSAMGGAIAADVGITVPEGFEVIAAAKRLSSPFRCSVVSMTGDVSFWRKTPE
jgi:hypothetical protein